MTQGEFDPRPGVRRIVIGGSVILGALLAFIFVGLALGFVQ